MKSMVIPYFSLGVILIAFTFIWHANTGLWLNGDVGHISIIKNYIIQRRKWTLWFLSCLFFEEIIFFFLVRIFKNDCKKIGLLSLLMTVAEIVYYKICGIPLPWNIDICFTSIIFFYAGYVFKSVDKINFISKKIKAQHQNVFLTALSCQGTFITF